MSCTLTTGFDLGCHDNRGGILELYFANYVSDFAVTQDSTGGVTDITGTSLTWYKYELEEETGNFLETYQQNRQNGAQWVEQSVNLVMNKLEQTKRNEIKLLLRARTAVIVRTANNGDDATAANGDYWLVGQTSGVRALAGGTGGTGETRGDRNGYNLNFGAKEADPAPMVYYSAFSAEIG